MPNSKYSPEDLPPFNNRRVELLTTPGERYVGSLQYDRGDPFVRIWLSDSPVQFGRTSPSDAPVGFVHMPRIAIRDIARIDLIGG